MPDTCQDDDCDIKTFDDLDGAEHCLKCVALMGAINDRPRFDRIAKARQCSGCGVFGLSGFPTPSSAKCTACTPAADPTMAVFSQNQASARAEVGSTRTHLRANNGLNLKRPGPSLKKATPASIQHHKSTGKAQAQLNLPKPPFVVVGILKYLHSPNAKPGDIAKIVPVFSDVLGAPSWKPEWDVSMKDLWQTAASKARKWWIAEDGPAKAGGKKLQELRIRAVMQRANGQYQAVDDLDPAITSQLYDFWTVNVVAEHEWGARNDSGTNAGCGSLRLFFAIINDLQELGSPARKRARKEELSAEPSELRLADEEEEEEEEEGGDVLAEIQRSPSRNRQPSGTSKKERKGKAQAMLPPSSTSSTQSVRSALGAFGFPPIAAKEPLIPVSDLILQSQTRAVRPDYTMHATGLTAFSTRRQIKFRTTLIDLDKNHRTVLTTTEDLCSGVLETVAFANGYVKVAYKFDYAEGEWVAKTHYQVMGPFKATPLHDGFDRELLVLEAQKSCMLGRLVANFEIKLHRAFGRISHGEPAPDPDCLNAPKFEVIPGLIIDLQISQTFNLDRGEDFRPSAHAPQVAPCPEAFLVEPRMYGREVRLMAARDDFGHPGRDDFVEGDPAYPEDPPMNWTGRALCHYIYNESSRVSIGEVMVIDDIQGFFQDPPPKHGRKTVHEKWPSIALTDTLVHSAQQTFGMGDGGPARVRFFLERHNCSPICTWLKLAPLPCYRDVALPYISDIPDFITGVRKGAAEPEPAAADAASPEVIPSAAQLLLNLQHCGEAGVGGPASEKSAADEPSLQKVAGV